MADESFNNSADCNLLKNELASAMEKLPRPRNYYHAMSAAAPSTPENVLVFLSRTLQLQGSGGSLASHHRFVLAMNLMTQGDVLIDRRLVTIREGEAILIFPYQFHGYANIRGDELRWLFITFEQEESESLQPLRFRTVKMTPEIFLHAKQLSSLYIKWYNDETTTTDEACFRVGLILQQLLANAHAPKRQTVLTREQSIVEEANRLVQKHLDEPLSLNEIARRMTISPSHLRNVFRAQTGVSLGVFLRRSRMHRSITLMSYPERNLTDIAGMCGYDSLFAFSRAFHSVIGMSPSAYRRLHVQHRQG